jgi:AraC-like DNA-binding protein
MFSTAAVPSPDSRKVGPATCTHGPAGTGSRILLRGTVAEIAEWHCVGQDAHLSGVDELGDMCAVVVTRRGAFARESGGRRVLSHAGTATLWYPRDAYRISHPVPGGDVCSVFRIPTSWFRELVARYDPAAAEAPVPRGRAPDAMLAGRSYLLHRLAVASARRSAVDGVGMLAAEEAAMAFLDAAVRQAYARADDRPETHGSGAARVHPGRGAYYAESAVELVARRFTERLTLRGIADEVGCSPYHLSRLVTAHTGVPIFRLVLRLRLQAALERVLDTRDSLSTIALDAGFASHSHFGDAFRREFGDAPGAIRRRAAAGHLSRTVSRLLAA